MVPPKGMPAVLLIEKIPSVPCGSEGIFRPYFYFVITTFCSLSFQETLAPRFSAIKRIGV